MPSSKFNRLPVPRLRPPICFPPPGSCRKAGAVNQPEVIMARYKWKDWHPPVPVDWYGLMTMHWQPDNLHYFGLHVFHGGYATLTFYLDPLYLVYTLDFRLHIEPDQYLINTWTDIPYAGLGIINTGHLWMINEPGIDYREARLIGPV